jgi:UDP-2-acetamido-2,6-beta-L-arabino-hexul-4-ose reductase
MIKVGITGQAGFIGTYLFNTLNLGKERFETIPFEDSFFSESSQLEKWVSKCDVIVHLAAVNRHKDINVLYETNLSLVKQLIAALEITNSKPHVIFSSSTQEERDNIYGKSKREGRQLLSDWAIRNNTKFTGLVIPNVFGPFGMPYYNSVVATFCHQLTHNETPKIDIDNELKLIYVGELAEIIIKHLIELSPVNSNKAIINTIEVDHTSKITVSDLFKKLSGFKEDYFEHGIIPDLSDTFEKNLFNTFVCYIDHKSFYPFYLKKNSDNRGSFIEVIKIVSGGQVSFSTTIAGITRGNHFHTRKAERFAVIKGKAIISLRRIGNNEVLNFQMDGSRPSFVDMPIWFTHNIINIGDEDLYTIFWINEFFNPDDSDTYTEIVDKIL